MTAFRFRWRPLVAVVLAVIWIVGVVRYVSRESSKPPVPLTTYVPVAPAPVPRIPQAGLAASTVVPAVPTAPAVAPVAPAVPAVAPAAPAAVALTAPAAMPTAPAAAADATAASSLHDRLWSAVPSVTSDGSLILVPVSGPFFARWEPNLLFVVWDRHGKVVQQQVVQDMEQDLSERGTPEVRAQVKAQELAAGKLLDALERKGLQSKDLQPAVLESDNAPFPHHAAYTKEGERAPSVTFDLSPTGTLTIKPRGHAAVTRHHAGWRSVPTPEQERRIQESISKGENGCYNPALLRGALVDLGRRIAIVTIGYHGSDSCWEGPDEQTVMAW